MWEAVHTLQVRVAGLDARHLVVQRPCEAVQAGSVEDEWWCEDGGGHKPERAAAICQVLLAVV
eukprot:20677-Eustigmatos_ZCMA.PRE.1